MYVEGLGYVRRTWDRGEGPRVDVKGQGIVRGPRRGMEGLGMGAKGFG